MPRAGGEKGKEQISSLPLCFEYSEVAYEMEYLRFHEWLVGGRVSIMLSRKTGEHKGKMCSTKMLHTSSIIFLGKTDIIYLVLSVLITLHCISTIKKNQ